MLKKIVSIVAFSFLVAAFLMGCSSKQESKPLMLKKYGPTDIRAGQIFNKQPSGESAIWAETENATPTTVVVLNNVELTSAPQNEGKVVTAVVPRGLHEKAGEFSLYLLDKKTKEKSNELKFIVKP